MGDFLIGVVFGAGGILGAVAIYNKVICPVAPIAVAANPTAATPAAPASNGLCSPQTASYPYVAGIVVAVLCSYFVGGPWAVGGALTSSAVLGLAVGGLS